MVIPVVVPILLALLAGPLSPADRLYELGLYDAAVTEYLRELHTDTTADPGLVRLKLALSRAAAGEIEPAAAELRRLVEDQDPTGPAAAFALAGLYATRGDFQRARFELLRLHRFLPEPDRPGLDLPLAWLELNSGQLAAARTRFDALGRTETAEYLSRPPARRSPELALALSSLLPGTGELYAGRAGRGLLSLIATGAGATGTWYAARSGDWVSAGVLFSFIFLRFYQGSRANAADMAEAFNRAALMDYVTRLAAGSDLEPDWFRPAEQLTGLPAPPQAGLRRPQD